MSSKKKWMIGLGALALILLVAMVMMSSPDNLGARSRPPSPDQVVFAPLTNSYNAAVNFWRPSNLRFFRQAILCGWFPSQPERLPWQWLVNLARGCNVP